MYIKTYKIPKTTMRGESPDPAFARQIYHVFVSDMRLEPDLLLVDIITIKRLQRVEWI